MNHINVKLRHISYETMMMCFPDSDCTRQQWADMRGGTYPLAMPIEQIGQNCMRGLPLYKTNQVASDGRAIGICNHIAVITGD